MLRPDGAHLLVRRKFALCCGSLGFIQRRLFVGRHIDFGLLFASKLKQHARQIILHFRRKGADRLHDVVEQVCHSSIIADRPTKFTSFRPRRENLRGGNPLWRGSNKKQRGAVSL